MSLAYCVPPAELYRYRLYRRSAQTRVAEFVYHHTTATFHESRSSTEDGAKPSRELLSDKERQTAELTLHGLPVAPILSVVRRGTGEPLEAFLHLSDVIFCKPRHGFQGRGAFRARRELDNTVIEMLEDGTRLDGDEAAAQWAELLLNDDMVIQRRLSIHPDFADVATADDIVTVRYISERTPDEASGIDCYCATLELPVGRAADTGHTNYVILQVDGLSGRVLGYRRDHLSRESAVAFDEIATRLGQRRVPDWDQICAGSRLAHTLFPGIHAIAWDWAITPDGPLLLEGNSGWGVATPQILKGGLLAQH
jgi:hypothetical protein